MLPSPVTTEADHCSWQSLERPAWKLLLVSSGVRPCPSGPHGPPLDTAGLSWNVRTRRNPCYCYTAHLYLTTHRKPHSLTNTERREHSLFSRLGYLLVKPARAGTRSALPRQRPRPPAPPAAGTAGRLQHCPRPPAGGARGPRLEGPEPGQRRVRAALTVRAGSRQAPAGWPGLYSGQSAERRPCCWDTATFFPQKAAAGTGRRAGHRASSVPRPGVPFPRQEQLESQELQSIPRWHWASCNGLQESRVVSGTKLGTNLCVSAQGACLCVRRRGGGPGEAADSGEGHSTQGVMISRSLLRLRTALIIICIRGGFGFGFFF